MDPVWKTAMELIAAHGIGGASDAVMKGIRTAPDDRPDLIEYWEAVGARVAEIMGASGTAH
ncbi:MAG TPA: hypothetical protein VFQ57_07810 [Sphingomonas sp.]|nr:hypothetical protein [Sphingomonas sp.]